MVSNISSFILKDPLDNFYTESQNSWLEQTFDLHLV